MLGLMFGFSMVVYYVITLLAKVLYNSKIKLPSPTRLPRSEKKAPYVFVAKNAFALHPNMIMPYLYTLMERISIIYNRRVSSAWNIVEDTFSILNSRFEIFHKAILIVLYSGKQMLVQPGLKEIHQTIHRIHIISTCS